VPRDEIEREPFLCAVLKEEPQPALVVHAADGGAAHAYAGIAVLHSLGRHLVEPEIPGHVRVLPEVCKVGSFQTSNSRALVYDSLCAGGQPIRDTGVPNGVELGHWRGYRLAE
jgi:hypothetical protein